MNVGSGLGSEGMLWSARKVTAFSRVSGYPSQENFQNLDAPGCHKFHHNHNIFSDWKEMVKLPEEMAC